MAGRADQGEELLATLHTFVLALWAVVVREDTQVTAGGDPFTDGATFGFGDGLAFRSRAGRHGLFVVAPLPAIPNPPLDFRPVSVGGFVIQPVGQHRGLTVMAARTFTHNNGPNVPKVGRGVRLAFRSQC